MVSMEPAATSTMIFAANRGVPIPRDAALAEEETGHGQCHGEHDEAAGPIRHVASVEPACDRERRAVLLAAGLALGAAAAPTAAPPTAPCRPSSPSTS
jgi:hypothetical protein